MDLRKVQWGKCLLNKNLSWKQQKLNHKDFVWKLNQEETRWKFGGIEAGPDNGEVSLVEKDMIKNLQL